VRLSELLIDTAKEPLPAISTAEPGVVTDRNAFKAQSSGFSIRIVYYLIIEKKIDAFSGSEKWPELQDRAAGEKICP
jgi:hypothetical protein